MFLSTEICKINCNVNGSVQQKLSLYGNQLWTASSVKKYIHGSCHERIRRWQFLISNIRLMKKKKGGETNKNKGLSKEQLCYWLKNCCKNWTVNIIFADSFIIELCPLLPFYCGNLNFSMNVCNKMVWHCQQLCRWYCTDWREFCLLYSVT